MLEPKTDVKAAAKGLFGGDVDVKPEPVNSGTPHFEHDWMLLKDCPVTQEKLWVQLRDDGKTWRVRVTAPNDVVQERLRLNGHLQAHWDSQTRPWWNKDSALVASIPAPLHYELKKKAGYDPAKGGDYDKDKFRKLLNDPDLAKLRTGGGRL